MNVKVGEAEAMTRSADARLDRATGRGAWSRIILRDARLLLIAIWLGAAVFSLVVAQVAFAVLPTRALAGAVVGGALAALNVGGFVISLLLLASLTLARGGATRRAIRIEAASLLIVAAATGVGRWIINARLDALRAAMGRPVDELATNDPSRIAFGQLHGYSVLALMAAMIAALAALLATARRYARSNA